MAYRCVFIDWHGTLCQSLFWQQRRDCAPLRTALFSAAGTHMGLLQPWTRGALTSEQVVGEIARATGIDYNLALDGLIASCREMVVPEAALNAVSALRAQGTKVVIATDNMDTFWRWTVPSLGLARRFDAILSSAALGAHKWEVDAAGRSPFFQPFLDRENIGLGESILLDDSAEGTSIIEGVGIDYRQIASPEELVRVLATLTTLSDKTIRSQ